MSILRYLLVAALVCIAPSAPVYAYGPDGHRIVCDLAYRFLSDAARAEVDRLIALDPHYQHFRDTCSWADMVRATSQRHTAPWHYTGQDRNDPVIDPEDCAEDGCIISAIELHAGILADSGRSDAERLEALKFLAHWIGDIHQPLHVSINGDRGGNDIPVLWRGERYTNMHRVWDSEIILDHMSEEWPWAPANERWTYFAEALAVETPLAGSTVFTPVQPIAWAQESHNIVRSRDFGYFWANSEQTLEPGDAYYQRSLRISRQQLKQGGVRLAGVLNRLLDNTVQVGAAGTAAPSSALD